MTNENPVQIWAASPEIKSALVLAVDALQGIEHGLDDGDGAATVLDALLSIDAPSGDEVLAAIRTGRDVAVIDGRTR